MVLIENFIQKFVLSYEESGCLTSDQKQFFSRKLDSLHFWAWIAHYWWMNGVLGEKREKFSHENLPQIGIF